MNKGEILSEIQGAWTSCEEDDQSKIYIAADKITDETAETTTLYWRGDIKQWVIGAFSVIVISLNEDGTITLTRNTDGPFSGASISYARSASV